MLNAKLIKALEKKGFSLDFPDYSSNDELITEILKQNNPRLWLSLPTILNSKFDYASILKNIDKAKKKEFDKIIRLSNKIYEIEQIENKLKEITKNHKIKEPFSNSEFDEFYAAFKDASSTLHETQQKTIEKQTKIRLNLDLNKSLAILFSPAKIRIMEKIFNHEKLTNTELKYYYRSISKINKAVSNPSLQEYLRIIEISKKHSR